MTQNIAVINIPMCGVEDLKCDIANAQNTPKNVSCRRVSIVDIAVYANLHLAWNVDLWYETFDKRICRPNKRCVSNNVLATVFGLGEISRRSGFRKSVQCEDRGRVIFLRRAFLACVPTPAKIFAVYFVGWGASYLQNVFANNSN